MFLLCARKITVTFTTRAHLPIFFLPRTLVNQRHSKLTCACLLFEINILPHPRLCHVCLEVCHRESGEVVVREKAWPLKQKKKQKNFTVTQMPFQ